MGMGFFEEDDETGPAESRVRFVMEFNINSKEAKEISDPVKRKEAAQEFYGDVEEGKEWRAAIFKIEQLPVKTEGQASAERQW